MNDFVIYTDSGADIRPALLAEWGVRSVSMSFRFEGEEGEYTEHDMEIPAFYDRMRAGGVAKTAAINPQSFADAFAETLSAGDDVLYIGFSSGLSTTVQSARLAASMLKEQYPKRTVTVVDTLAASAGEGLLLYFASQKKEAGASAAEIAAYIDSVKDSLAHWFTVDDLVYLKRGGRVSPTAAFIGNMLGIKPVLHVDGAGKLIPIAKVRGRKNSLSALADRFGETVLDKTGGTVFICHADCESDADFLKDMLCERYGASVHLVTEIGPVIGAHSGPGTISLFFLATEK